MPVIRAVFPDAKIILIRRDKKDAIASYMRHFNARTSLRNRLLSDRMLLKKQCRICYYYEQIEEWLATHAWCRTVDYKQMIEAPFETVRDILRWVGMSIDVMKYGPLFVPEEASSKWNRLTTDEQRIVESLLMGKSSH